MTGATLFTGIMAMEQAAPWVQWKWCAEINVDACGVIRYHHPELPNLGDVTDATFIERAREFGPIDLLAFGSPCQSFSVAGRRLGLDDPRGNLALVAMGIVKALRPRWFVFENVPGLLSSGERRDLGAFLGTVAECGYWWSWRVLDAQYTGVPQRRRRIFLVGHSRDWRRPAAVLFEPESLPRNNKARREKGKSSPRPANASARLRRFWESLVSAFAEGAEGAQARSAAAESSIAVDFRNTRLGGSVTGTLQTKPNGGYSLNFQPGILEPLAFEQRFARNGRGTPDSVTAPLKAENGRTGKGDGAPCVAFTSKDYGGDADNLAPTLRAMPHDASHANGGGQVAVGFYSNLGTHGGGVEEGLMPPLKAGSHENLSAIAQPWGVRRLMPVECERLQGLQDGWTQYARLPDGRIKELADGPRYRLIGNSMAVPCVRWFMDRLRILEGEAEL